MALIMQRYILQEADNKRFNPSCVIAREYNKFECIAVRTRKIRRCLHNNQISNYTAASKCYQSTYHLRARMQWTTRHLSWTNAKWNTVILSDEFIFTVRTIASRKKVQRKAYSEFELWYLVLTFKSESISVSVWGAFSSMDTHNWCISMRIWNKSNISQYYIIRYFLLVWNIRDAL